MKLFVNEPFNMEFRLTLSGLENERSAKKQFDSFFSKFIDLFFMGDFSLFFDVMLSSSNKFLCYYYQSIGIEVIEVPKPKISKQELNKMRTKKNKEKKMKFSEQMSLVKHCSEAAKDEIIDIFKSFLPVNEVISLFSF